MRAIWQRVRSWFRRPVRPQYFAAPDMWDPSDREERSYQQRRPRLTHRRIGGQR